MQLLLGFGYYYCVRDNVKVNNANEIRTSACVGARSMRRHNVTVKRAAGFVKRIYLHLTTLAVSSTNLVTPLTCSPNMDSPGSGIADTRNSPFLLQECARAMPVLDVHACESR